MERTKTERYLSTISNQDSKHPFVKIEITNYEHLGAVLRSLLAVCANGMDSKNDYKGIDNIDYRNILELAMQLIPYNELELLTKLQFNSIDNE